MDILRNGAKPSSQGPAESFTGAVRRDPFVASKAPSRLAAGQVTFEPGARTHWHTHPAGQLLIITSGFGRVGSWGGEIQEVSAGDTIWFDAGEKHWHGAGKETAMSHIAVTESVDGSPVEWLEPVTEAQYRGA